jgi:tRNA (guanine-N7-)-methyltransferase
LIPESIPARQEAGHSRPPRSFVLRGGRLTEGQKRALSELWPRFGIEDSNEMLDFRALFGNPGPVVLDIGFGNGESTWHMARDRPDENYLGVEVHRPGVGHLLLKIEEHGLGNIRIACADVVEFLRLRVADGSLAGARLYFPDPWPKKRHHKRRLVQPGFVTLLADKLAPGGVWHVATDWSPYAEHILEVMASCSRFENLSVSGDSCPRPPWRVVTRYENRGIKLGHPVHDLIFRKRG